jgi:methyltransferase (TIGR00027 family)
MAERTAMMRAAHQLLDDEPKLFRDPLALPVLGAAGRRWLDENIGIYATEPMRRARTMTVIRARFAEEELDRAIATGVRQYVILGAGLDTFAYRRAAVAADLTVFEVDQPATQRWKLERLAEAGVAVPPDVQFVPLDFNEQSLAAGLARAGFQRDAPAFFSWLGVSYYLPRDSVLETLAFIAGQVARSQVVFDFAVEYSALSPYFQDKMSQVVAQTGRDGEVWQTRFAPQDLAVELRRLGFSGTFHLTMEMAEKRYLHGRRDGLLIGAIVQIMSAWT